MAIDFSSISNSSSYSSLFDSLSTSSTSSGDASSSLFTDWASLKNGTTAKLAKAYYGNSETKTTKNAAAEAAKETIKANNTVKSDATSLKDAAGALADSKSLFSVKVNTRDKDGKEIKDEAGNPVKDYDRDKIAATLKDFVEGYNSVVKSGGDSDNKNVLRNTMYMTQITKKNESLLADVGISIGEDNKLSIDEEKVKSADISDLKALFSGTGSYASSVESKATEIINAVNNENNRLASYTRDGGYANADTVGKLYDGTY